MNNQNPHKFHWTNERRMPDELVEILNAPDVPEDLRRELLRAQEELKESGAVSYPTESRIDYYIDLHKEYIAAYLSKKTEKEGKAP